MNQLRFIFSVWILALTSMVLGCATGTGRTAPVSAENISKHASQTKNNSGTSTAKPPTNEETHIESIELPSTESNDTQYQEDKSTSSPGTEDSSHPHASESINAPEPVTPENTGANNPLELSQKEETNIEPLLDEQKNEKMETVSSDSIKTEDSQSLSESTRQQGSKDGSKPKSKSGMKWRVRWKKAKSTEEAEQN